MLYTEHQWNSPRTYKGKGIAKQDEAWLMFGKFIRQLAHVFVDFVVGLFDFHCLLIDLIFLEWSGISPVVLAEKFISR